MSCIIFSLGDVKVSDVSDMVSEAGRAYDVEQCSCGTGYTGLSCEVWHSLICELHVEPVYLTISPWGDAEWAIDLLPLRAKGLIVLVSTD